MKYLTLVSFCIFFLGASVLNAQEICDNGIDDDGDGLTDLMDGDCLCGIVFHQEFRGDFEDFDCCPTGITQFDCLGGDWEQANDFTPDYFNMCGFMGGNGVPPVPLPLPSGEGAIGFLSCGGCHDNAGLCMPYTMLPGETYDVSFYVGFNEGGGNLFSDLDVEISFFGTNDCSFLPSNDEFCLTDFEAWYELGTYDVHATSLDSWEFRTGDFVAVEPTEAIAIGTSCAFSADATNQYHFFDDVRISGNFLDPAEETDIEFEGDCGAGYFLTALDNSGATYQWYLDGIAVIPGTGNPFQVPLGQDGNYQVMITYPDGTCKISDKLDVETDPYELELVDIIMDVDCQGLDNGSIDIIPNSTNMPFTFQWNSGQNDPYIDDLPPGNYTITVTDANGCIGIETYQVEEPDLLSLDVYVEQPTLETPLGYAELIIYGGTEPYIITWSNGNDELTDDTLETGIYTIMVVDANGCEDIITFEIFEVLGAVSIIVNESCYDACNGVITITDIFGGAPPYEIDWNVPGSGFEIDDLCAGLYSYMIEDSIGTVYWGDVEIDPGEDMELDFNYQEVLCDDTATTPVDLTVYGGAQPLSFEWSNGMVTEDLASAQSGSYSITVSDEAGCFVTEEFIIEASTPIDVDALIIEAPCGLVGQGSIDLTVSGGTSPFVFSWNSGETTEDLSGLFSGIYELTITDKNGCNYLESYEVTSNTDMGVTSNINQIVCNADLTGAISLSVLGGTAPIDYLWSTGDTGSELTDLGAGDYGITITDALDCIWTNNIIIAAQSQMAVDEQITPIVCYGEATGSIDLSITSSGVVSNYSWSNGMDSKDVSDLIAGEYRLTITDDFGCNYEYIFQIDENPEFEIQETVVDVDCNGSDEGQILINTDGVGVYEFEWSNGSLEDNIINQTSGLYNVTISNDQDCDQEYEFLISEPEEIFINSTVIHAGCSQGGSGNIQIDPTGGESPYIISWSTGSDVDEIQNLSAGMYGLTLTDGNGCVVEESFVINDAVPIAVEDVSTNITCFGGSNGSISLNVTGGTAPFNYMWNTGEDTNTIAGLTVGAYSVLVVDDNNCTEELFFMIEEPSNVEIFENIEDSRCFGGQGTIDIDITGGVEPYDIHWNTGENTNQISGIAGNYDVEVLDNNGCLYTFTYVIAQPLELGANVLNSFAPNQLGYNGMAELSITGGTEPYDIQWSNGSVGTVVNNLGFGLHTATIIDANGCETIVELSFVPEDLSYVFAREDNLCYEDCVATIKLDISGGQEPYTVLWSNGSSGFIATDLCEGQYSATITDALGIVSETEIFTVVEPLELTVSPSIKEVSCVNVNDGSILVNPSGGTPPYSYNWNNNSTANLVDNLSPGIYEVTVNDANQCSIVETYEIRELVELDISLIPVKAQCESELGSIQVEGDGLLNTEFVIDGQNVGVLVNGILEDISIGYHEIAYIINGNCALSLGQIEISKFEEVSLVVSPDNVEVKLDEIVTIELNLISENPISNYSIDWQSINPVVCNEYDESSACISIELVAIESEVLRVEFVDENGCLESVEIRIRVIDPPVIVLPNIFSPNGDGENEAFVFHTSRKVESVKTFTIYDRWGSVMHQQENNSSRLMEWNGRSSGKDVSAGVYIYHIELQLIDGSNERFTGDLTLVR